MNFKKMIFAAALLLAAAPTFAQIFDRKEREEVIVINGQKVPVLIQGKDTILLASLDEVDITSTRLFKNDKERYRYNQMRYNAKKVMGYAVEAIRLHEDLKQETADMKRGKKRTRVREVQRELQDKFEKPLKGLYRSQGLLLIKMIERETGESMYSLISEYKGGLTAFYWNTLGSFYEYKLRETYDPAADPAMESIFKELNLKQAVLDSRAREKAAKK